MRLSLSKLTPLFVTSLCFSVGSASATETPAPLSFSRDIRPILSANCFKCHGPDDAKDDKGKSLRKAGLRLDVADDQDWQELITRIISTDEEEIMPPPEANKTLKPDEITLLKRWIHEGADYEKHWAFVPPEKSPVPENAHPIDHLFKTPLAKKADPYTLIRRVHLDLIGLPPTIEVADTFAANPTPEAFAKVVDDLLASPRYGERWARRWLDLARYADTNGYEKDRDRSIWPYRDYVIQSLNDDKPFDQFSIEQLAGDMLPNATPEQIIATGFHRNTMLNEEGGIDPLEFRYHAMTDRVATTGTVWLGLTTGCAQCHTHKYDPITHHDYFGLFAYLNNTNEPDYFIPTPDLEKRQKDNRARAEKLLAELPGHWPASGKMEYKPQLVRSATAAHSKLDSHEFFVAPSGPPAEKDTYTVTLETKEQNLSALRLDTFAFNGKGPGQTEHGNFVLNEIEITVAPLDNSAPPQKITLAKAAASIEQDGFPAAHAIDGKPATGWAIHNPKEPLHKPQHADFFFKTPVSHPSGTRFTVTLVQNYGSQHTIGSFRLSLGKPAPSNQAPADHLQKSYQAWLAREKANLPPWQIQIPTDSKANIPYLTLEEDGVIFAAGDISKHDIFTLNFPASDQAIHSLRLEALPDERLPAGGPGMTYYEGRKGDFFLSEFEVITDKKLPFSGSSETASQSQFGSGSATASAAIDGDIQSGWSLKDKIGQRQIAVFNLTEAIPPNTAFQVTMHFGRHFAATLGKFRISTSPTSSPKAIIHQGTLQDFLLQAPELKDQADEIRGLLKPVTGTPTLVMTERPPGRTRPTHLHHRGEYTQPKDTVPPRLPDAIYPKGKPLPKDRLELAQWLFSRENPLTARVVVNRHWAAFFGTGIVPTLDDFGMQGQLPTHPELLDHLAVTFIDKGWSLKKLHRLIVTSDTYQQDSKIESSISKQFPRQRLEAEIIRDSALAAAGLLSEKMFGPPVRPTQPAGVTEIAYGSPKWNTSKGEDRFRRSIYTYQKRTAPFAMFTTFDAGSGEACLAKRDRSNTPLQALTLMNDPMFIEIANHFGELLEKSEATPEEKITLAFRKLLTRPPTPDEVRNLSDFHQKHPAWSALTRALLSLDESVTKN
ncbi:PSD1 and planctomycete cytochrome C domain-containing protein [Verrucomicrobiaceae bacterium 227]